MKRFVLSVSVFAFVAALGQACGGASDDLALDASNDQTSGNDAVGSDATGSDATSGGDVVASDATQDVVETDATDASQDVAPVDGAPDVVSIDAGGNCTSNANCLLTEYCERGTGKCSGKGTCTPRPAFCNSLIAPVCGCDKQTYSNECYAHKAGETVAYTGGCE